MWIKESQALSRQIIQRKRYCWLFHFCSIFVCLLCVFVCVCVLLCVLLCVCVYACVQSGFRWDGRQACWQSGRHGDGAKHGGKVYTDATDGADCYPGSAGQLPLAVHLFCSACSFVISSSCLSYHSLFSPFIFLFVISFSSLSFHHPLCYTILFSVLLFSSLSYHSHLCHFVLLFVISSSVFSVSSLSFNPLCHLIPFVI